MNSAKLVRSITTEQGVNEKEALMHGAEEKLKKFGETEATVHAKD